MPRTFYKHKLLLDENMPQRQIFPRLNEHFDVKHIRDDLHSGGFSDTQVYELAVAQQRLIVTYNVKDFKALADRSQETGVIGVSANIPLHQVDTKLTALLLRSNEKALFGQYTPLSEAA